ncbi:MAG TPA: aminotransferase class I/II-fold pyridoxal phosphate-dependent enzyme [Polyangiaceae bacterium]
MPRDFRTWDTVIAPDPSYPIHRGAPLIAGAEVVTYRAHEDVPPGEAVAEALQKARARGTPAKLVIANYPQNPTGRAASHGELADLVGVVAKSGAFLLHDLAYADFDFSNRYAPSIFNCGLPAAEVARFGVEAFSMSKSYNMPGWRIAFLAGNQRLIGALAHLKSYMDYGTFAPLQYAAAWALANGDKFVDDIRELYQERAVSLSSGLRAAGWDVKEPQGTMFLWARLPPEWQHLTSLEAGVRLLEQAKVAVSPGSGFGPGGEGYVRFALVEERERILQACERIGKELRAQ